MISATDWQRVKAVFHGAMDLPQPDRAPYLTRACAGNAWLLKEVQTLLAAHESDPNFLEESAVGEAVARFEQRSTHERIGRRLGPYQLVAELGHGGMGQVFRARRVDGQYQSEVAIKLMRAGCESPSVLKRFLAERQILATLTHPSIARLLDGGTSEDGAPYLVMELVDGIRIDHYCTQNRLPVEARLALFLCVCEAVSYAHRHLVVHRDLKPGNILITQDGKAKLLDFGVAKVLDSMAQSGSNRATVTLMRALTVNFSSPEQIRGEPITTASDVYSLGVLLYHLLTDASPYASAKGPPGAVVREICERQPNLPSRAPLPPSAPCSERKWQTQLRGDLDSITMLALQKDPAHRYKSVDLFAEDIQRHLTNRPVRARDNALGDQIIKLIRRHRIAAAASLAALVLLTAAATWATHAARASQAASSERYAAAHRTARVLLEQLESQAPSPSHTGQLQQRPTAQLDDQRSKPPHAADEPLEARAKTPSTPQAPEHPEALSTEQFLTRLEQLAAKAHNDEAIRRALEEEQRTALAARSR